LDKPRVVIGTKIDEQGCNERLALLQASLGDTPVIGLSNITSEGLEEVKRAFIALVQSYGRTKRVEQDFSSSFDSEAEYREEP